MECLWPALAIPAVLVAAVGIRDFIEGKTLVHDTLDEWRLARADLHALDRAWAANPNRSEVMVSLTTIPSRLPRRSEMLRNRYGRTEL